MLFTLGSLATAAHAQTGHMTRLHAALMSPDRPAADKEKDAARKPGGVFGVINHQGMPGNADLNKQNHRMDVATAKDLLTKAGFTIQAESDLLHNPADDHMHGTMAGSLRGSSDRFCVIARKPSWS